MSYPIKVHSLSSDQSSLPIVNSHPMVMLSALFCNNLNCGVLKHSRPDSLHSPPANLLYFPHSNLICFPNIKINWKVEAVLTYWKRSSMHCQGTSTRGQNRTSVDRSDLQILSQGFEKKEKLGQFPELLGAGGGYFNLY